MRVLIFVSYCLVFSVWTIFGQQNSLAPDTKQTKAVLFDSFTDFNAELNSSRIDKLLNEAGKNSKNKAVIFVYCGRTCKYGEVEAHFRGIKIKMKLRGVPADRYLILAGGYREQTETELWFVPENACPPIPNSTVDIQNVKFKDKFKGAFVPYECCP